MRDLEVDSRISARALKLARTTIGDSLGDSLRGTAPIRKFLRDRGMGRPTGRNIFGHGELCDPSRLPSAKIRTRSSVPRRFLRGTQTDDRP